MNPPRRTMVAALTQPLSPEAVLIIKEGTPKPQTPVLTLSAPPPENPRLETQEPKPVPTPPAAKPKPQKEKTIESVGLVALNCRVPSEITIALLKASSERKIKKARPFTQQEIIGDALFDWLKKNGYLG